MTGRAAGRCAGYPAPGYANAVGGRGFWGCGRGGGRGWRNWFRATGLTRWARGGYGLAGGIQAVKMSDAPGREVEDLRRQADSLEGTLGEIRRRIETLESNRSGKDTE